MEKLILDEKKIVNQYEKLKNVNKVAEIFNVSVSTISRRLRKNNVIITRKFDTLNDSDVLEQYSIFKNIHKVAKHFNMSTNPIKKILKTNGIDLTNRRYDVNHNYFDIIDTEEKAYWLGFLYADGYIRERKNGDSLEMKLSIKDKKHLELFRDCIGSNHKIVEGLNSVKYKGEISSSHMCHLSMYSSKLVDSIKKQGIHSRKTYTIEKPDIDSKLLHHFIRGYFDGDGTFLFKEKKRIVSGFVTVSTKFRQFLIDELKNSANISNFYIDEKRGYLMIYNKINNNNFYKYIYNNSTIYLERKKDIYEKFRQYYQYSD